MSRHFEDKGALGHVLEKRAGGSTAEAHGTELPGYLSAGLDALRESAMVLVLIWLFFILLNVPLQKISPLLIAFGLGWVIWKGGRSGWLGWSRLERLHRLIEQEKYEIEHHRPQEREELVALYKAKGFEGKLLEDVVDVLMADQDRLLKVMLEEEMGLTLQAYEHPLQQGLGGAIGALIAVLCTGIAFYFLPAWGVPLSSFCLIFIASLFSVFFEGNQAVRALVWNLSIASLSFGVAYFIFRAITG